MKRLLSFMLTLTMLLGLPGALAQAEAPLLNEDISVPQDVWLTSAALHQGRILMGGSNLYEVVPGTGEMQLLVSLREAEWVSRYPDINSLVLASDGDTLYGLDANGKMLHTLTLDGNNLTLSDGVQLDLQPLTETFPDGGEYTMHPAQMLITGGRVYMIARAYGGNGPELKLFSYDLVAGGAPTMHTAEFVQQLTPYEDGKLLAVVMDEGNAYDPGAGGNVAATLAVWDPTTDTLESIGDTGMPWRHQSPGVLYDAKSGYLYIAGDSEVYRRDSQGRSEVCAYLTPTNTGGEFSGRVLLLQDGRLAVSKGDGVSLRSADPKDLPAERLMIYGSYMDDTHKKTIQQMAGTAVSFLDNKHYATAQQLGQALVGGEDDIDIFVLTSTHMDLQSLMAKGYAQPLDQSQVIQEHMQALYPFMAETGMLNGQTMLVPISMEGNLRGYYPDLMERVGVQAPTTFEEMCQLLEKWNDELGEQYPDYLPMQSPDIIMEMVGIALSLYAQEQAAQGQPFSFLDPKLKPLLERAANLRTEDISQKVDWTEPGADMGEIYNKAPLMENWYHLQLSSLDRLFSRTPGTHTISYGNSGVTHDVGMSRPMLLALDADSPARLPLTLTLMAVNPRGKHVESAIRYVENYVQQLSAETRAMMCPALNDPIPNPDADRINQWMSEYAKEMERQIAKATGAEKTEMEENYKRHMAEYELQREDTKWLVRAEALQMYREMMENAFVQGHDDFIAALQSRDIMEPLKRYMNGQMPLDQFLQEAEGKLRLMRLENE